MLLVANWFFLGSCRHLPVVRVMPEDCQWPLKHGGNSHRSQSIYISQSQNWQHNQFQIICHVQLIVPLPQIKAYEAVYHESLTRFVKLRVAHASEMPGTFFASCNACRDRYRWWRGTRSRDSRRKSSSQIYVSDNRPMHSIAAILVHGDVLIIWAANALPIPYMKIMGRKINASFHGWRYRR